MDVCRHIGLILHFILFQIPRSTGNQGCESSSYINHWAISDVNVRIPSYNSKNCIVLKDPTTFKDHHGYPSDQEPESLRGRHSLFICSVRPQVDCQNVTTTLHVGKSATCDLLKTTKSIFKIGGKDNFMCNTNTECKSVLYLNIKQVKGPKKHKSVYLIHETTDINFTIDGFRSFQLSYQTCMDEVLEFQLPVSAVVPLHVTCKEHTGHMYLNEECLTPESTQKDLIFTDEIVTTDSFTNDTHATVIPLEQLFPFHSNTTDLRKKVILKGLIGVTTVYFLVGIILAVKYVITNHNQRKELQRIPLKVV